jgi:hypothetical protein
LYCSEVQGHEALTAARQLSRSVGVTVANTLAGTLLLEGTPQ